MSPGGTAAPEYGGECAFAVGLGKRGVTGQESCHAVRDGKHYVFSNPVARVLWRVLPGRRAAADRQWAARRGPPSDPR